MKLKIANPTAGSQREAEINDDFFGLCTFCFFFHLDINFRRDMYNEKISQEVLGEKFEGYISWIKGGYDTCECLPVVSPLAGVGLPVSDNNKYVATKIDDLPLQKKQKTN